MTALVHLGGTDSATKEAYFSLFNHRVPLDFYNEKLFLVWKGALFAFRNLRLLKNVDL